MVILITVILLFTILILISGMQALVDKNLSIIRDAVHFTRKQQQLVYAEEVYELADEKVVLL